MKIHGGREGGGYGLEQTSPEIVVLDVREIWKFIGNTEDIICNLDNPNNHLFNFSIF